MKRNNDYQKGFQVDNRAQVGFSRICFKEFDKIKEKSRIKKSFTNEVRFILMQGNENFMELNGFISGECSLDNSLCYSQMNHFLEYFRDCYYLHLNIKLTKFIRIRSVFPNKSISKLDHQTDESLIYLDFD